METQVVWWQILILMVSPMIMGLLAVIIGGWLVFKAKTITMPTPFLSGVKKPDKSPVSYAPDVGDDFNDAVFDETLSSAAARLRSQKNENLKIIKGKS